MSKLLKISEASELTRLTVKTLYSDGGHTRRKKEMGYDFQQGEESFHWSGDNWLRIIQMARRFGFDEEIGKQVETLSAETVNKLKDALWKALDAGALPLMDIRTGLDVWKGAMPDHVHTTSNAFFFSVGGHELVITEENTRWQGVFFWKLLEFTNGLQDAEMIVS